MLTLTYALVALSVEQKKVQGRLLELQQSVQRERNREETIEQAKAESLLTDFLQLDDACLSRNVELFVLPAIRCATPEANSLLADIETLTSTGRIILKNLRKTAAQGVLEIDDFFEFLEMYCETLMKRLTIEELHILPLAQRVISSEEWFDIAAKFISHESEKHPKKSFEREMASMFPASHVAANDQRGNLYQVSV